MCVILFNNSETTQSLRATTTDTNICVQCTVFVLVGGNGGGYGNVASTGQL